MSHRSGIDNVGIFGIHHDGAGGVRFAQAGILPAFARVGGLVNAVAGNHVAADVSLTRARVKNVGIRGRHHNGADAGTGPRYLAVRNVSPGNALIRALPHPAAHRSGIEQIGVGGNTGYGDHAPADVWADGAPFELAHQRVRTDCACVLRTRDCGKWHSNSKKKQDAELLHSDQGIHDSLSWLDFPPTSLRLGILHPAGGSAPQVPSGASRIARRFEAQGRSGPQEGVLRVALREDSSIRVNQLEDRLFAPPSAVLHTMQGTYVIRVHNGSTEWVTSNREHPREMRSRCSATFIPTMRWYCGLRKSYRPVRELLAGRVIGNSLSFVLRLRCWFCA